MKPLYIEESSLDAQMINALIQSEHKGVILNATKHYPELKNFYISLTPENVEKFQEGVIAKLPMERIVLASSYPHFGFDEIFVLSKTISDKNFRPDPSMIATATKNALSLFSF